MTFLIYFYIGFTAINTFLSAIFLEKIYKILRDFRRDIDAGKKD